MLVKFKVNGDPVEVNLKSDDRLLVDVLIVGGGPIAACLQLAALCEGADVRTIEGLAESSRCIRYSRPL
jgi:aerobic-type carbon monoxide dehydrogenase small subunit (CoxS/CutS family)